MTLHQSDQPLAAYFRTLSAPPERPQRRKTPPFSLRLTAEERARIKEQAGSQPLGAYIRRRLLSDEAAPR